MLELYELRQFKTFAEARTLSKAAEILRISQPALSRNMKKLEEDLGISLFARTKNRLTLNQNGEFVLDLTRALLEDADDLVVKARDFDRRNRTISLGSCAPAPIWRLAPLLANLYPYMSVQTELDSDSRLLADLDVGRHQLIVLHDAPADDALYSMECGKETLMFSLPKGHRFARRKSLSFAEMNGENMLLFSELGFWNFVPDTMMPDSHFLVQYDRSSFDQLVEASTLPSFSSDIAKNHFKQSASRVHIPISDPQATVTFYLVCKRKKKADFLALFDSL